MPEPALDAVVMAAGEGRRLDPLTKRWPKPILPIDGRPVIAVLLRELAAAGFGTVTIVVGHLAERIEALVGDGSAFGLAVRYARQQRALGSADAVSRALEAGARPPLVVTAADTVFCRGDLGRACAAWLASGDPGGLGVRVVAPPALREQTRVRVECGRVTAVGGEPQTHSGGTLTGAPVWFLDDELAAACRRVPGPPFELAAAFREAIAAGKKIAALELGPTRDLTRPDDVVTRNFPYLGTGETRFPP
jgi:dTDP-glucose pyrophosphorylase